MSNDKFARSVYLKPETEKILENAIEFVKQMEKDLEIDLKESRWRLPNNQVDKDLVIREALEEKYGKEGGGESL